MAVAAGLLSGADSSQPPQRADEDSKQTRVPPLRRPESRMMKMFGQTVEKSWNFDSVLQTEALNRLMYVVEQGEPFVLLLGASGTGKSTILKQLQSDCTRCGHSVMLINVAALDEYAFFWQLCGGLSICPRADQSRSELMVAVRDEVSGRSVCDHRTIIIMDDLQRAAEDLKPAVRFLSGINELTAGAVTVVAATDGSPAPGLQNLSALRVHLDMLDDDDANRFTRGMLKSLAVDTARLSDDAMTAVNSFGAGSPARLARLCRIIQVAVSTSPQLQITPDVVEVLTRETLLSRAG